jgi:hypothetical protein
MPEDGLVRTEADDQTQALAQQLHGSTDPKQKALAMGLELSKRALDAASLDELFFILTNDVRTLARFDRALLVTHMGGQSSFVAATNQPVLRERFDFYQRVSELAEQLRGVDKGVLLSADADATKLSEEDLSRETKDRLLSYMGIAGCAFLLCVPLKHSNSLMGHLLLEFYEKSLPSQIEILTLFSIAPFFASALSEKWLLHEKPMLQAALFSRGEVRKVFGTKSLVAASVLCLAIVAVLFGFPMTETVGGDSEVLPRDKFLAFVRTDGLVERINVKEDTRVEQGQVLAVLDPKDLDHEIKLAERKFEILTQELMLLRRESGQDPSKLGESKLVELKRTSAWEELEYLRWKSRFLEVRAPVSGIVVTKEVDSLVGKKFRAGEPFCEIAVPEELWATIYVPEDKVSLIKQGQAGTIYLNNEPSRPYAIQVAEIAPTAQALPRLGNVYRVSSTFKEFPKYLKVGMKGVGKIEVGPSNLATITGRRLLARWNQLSIYF